MLKNEDGCSRHTISRLSASTAHSAHHYHVATDLVRPFHEEVIWALKMQDGTITDRFCPLQVEQCRPVSNRKPLTSIIITSKRLVCIWHQHEITDCELATAKINNANCVKQVRLLYTLIPVLKFQEWTNLLLFIKVTVVLRYTARYMLWLCVCTWHVFPT